MTLRRGQNIDSRSPSPSLAGLSGISCPGDRKRVLRPSSWNDCFRGDGAPSTLASCVATPAMEGPPATGLTPSSSSPRGHSALRIVGQMSRTNVQADGLTGRGAGGLPPRAPFRSAFASVAESLSVFLKCCSGHSGSERNNNKFTFYVRTARRPALGTGSGRARGCVTHIRWFAPHQGNKWWKVRSCPHFKDEVRETEKVILITVRADSAVLRLRTHPPATGPSHTDAGPGWTPTARPRLVPAAPLLDLPIA